MNTRPMRQSRKGQISFFSFISFLLTIKSDFLQAFSLSRDVFSSFLRCASHSIPGLALCVFPLATGSALSAFPQASFMPQDMQSSFEGETNVTHHHRTGQPPTKRKKIRTCTFTEQLWYCHISWISNCDSIKVRIHCPAPSRKAAWTVITSAWCLMRSPIPVAYSLQPWQLSPLHQTSCTTCPQTLLQTVLSGFIQDKALSSYYAVLMKSPFLTVQ